MAAWATHPRHATTITSNAGHNVGEAIQEVELVQCLHLPTPVLLATLLLRIEEKGGMQDGPPTLLPPGADYNK